MSASGENGCAIELEVLNKQDSGAWGHNNGPDVHWNDLTRDQNEERLALERDIAHGILNHGTLPRFLRMDDNESGSESGNNIGTAIRSGDLQALEKMDLESIHLTTFYLDINVTELPKGTPSKRRLVLRAFHLAVVCQRSEVLQHFLQRSRRQRPLKEHFAQRTEFRVDDRPLDILTNGDKSLHKMNLFHLAAKYHWKSLSILLDFMREESPDCGLAELITDQSKIMVRQTPLHFAAKYQDDISDLISAIKQLGVIPDDLNVQDSRGMTPLHLAVRQDRLGTVQQLLENGADPNLWGDHDHRLTPLHRASSPEVVRLLLSRGTKLHPEIPDNKNNERKPKSALMALLEDSPASAMEIFENAVSTNGKSLDSKELKIVIDFGLFGMEEEGEIAVLSKMVELNLERMLPNTVCRTFIHLKRKLAWAHFVADVLYSALIFLMMAFGVGGTYYAYDNCVSGMEGNATLYQIPNCRKLPRDSLMTSLPVLLASLFLFTSNLWRAQIDGGTSFLKKLGNYYKYQLDEVALIVSGICFFGLAIGLSPSPEAFLVPCQILGTVSLGCSTSTLVETLGSHPGSTIFIKAFHSVQKRLFYFLVLYSFILVTFGIIFYLIDPIDKTIFVHVLPNFGKMLSMMSGELSYEEHFGSGWRNFDFQRYLALFAFLAFFFWVHIIAGNLILSFAVSDTSKMIENGEPYILKTGVCRLEKLSHSVFSKVLGCCCGPTELFEANGITAAGSDIPDNFKICIRMDSYTNPGYFKKTFSPIKHTRQYDVFHFDDEKREKSDHRKLRVTADESIVKSAIAQLKQREPNVVVSPKADPAIDSSCNCSDGLADIKKSLENIQGRLAKIDVALEMLKDAK